MPAFSHKRVALLSHQGRHRAAGLIAMKSGSELLAGSQVDLNGLHIDALLCDHHAGPARARRAGAIVKLIMVGSPLHALLGERLRASIRNPRRVFNLRAKARSVPSSNKRRPERARVWHGEGVAAVIHRSAENRACGLLHESRAERELGVAGIIGDQQHPARKFGPIIASMPSNRSQPSSSSACRRNRSALTMSTALAKRARRNVFGQAASSCQRS
jgi:hypothetical protein